MRRARAQQQRLLANLELLGARAKLRAAARGAVAHAGRAHGGSVVIVIHVVVSVGRDCAILTVRAARAHARRGREALVRPLRVIRRLARVVVGGAARVGGARTGARVGAAMSFVTRVGKHRLLILHLHYARRPSGARAKPLCRQARARYQKWKVCF